MALSARATADAATLARGALTALERVLTRAAIGAARTAVRLGAVAQRHEAIEGSARAVEQVIGEIRDGLARAAPAAAHSAHAAERVTLLTREGREASARALGAVRSLLQHGQTSDRRLQQLLARVQEVTSVSRMIDDIAVKTRFLALNATIEASRAGVAGKTFAVVAAEVRELANSTADKTRKIEELVQAIVALAQPARGDLEHSRALGEDVASSVSSVDERLSEIYGLASQTSTHANEIARVIDDDHRAVETLSAASAEVVSAIAELRDEATHLGKAAFAVSGITDDGYRELSALELDTPFHRGLAACRQLASDTGQILGRAVEQRRCSLDAVLALQYREITGAQIGTLAALFDVRRVPADGFTPPKFRTAYDALVDRELQAAGDARLEVDASLLFALAIDLNSYAPSHNKKFCQAWTGDPAKDLAGNRVKRFFTDNAILVRGARVGLPPAALGLPARASRDDFARAGARLGAPAGDDFLCQTYARDTGALVTVVTVPVVVQGQRWGAALVGWSAEDAHST